MATPTPQELLDLPLPLNDSGASTVRGYLVALLAEVWRENEGFSGKRPFGNSSWEYELYCPMAKAGLLGKMPADTEVSDFAYEHRHQADELILGAIAALGPAST